MSLRTVVIAAAVVASSSVSGGVVPQAEPLMFMADLQGKFVAPAAVETAATGKATAVLVGHTFTVHGSFAGLSSPLRDLTTKPDDPGVHLHRGAVGETTPYFKGLQVTLNPDGRSGVFLGVVTLDDEQRTRLLEGRTYVDIHTVKFGPGEVRDQWRPADPKRAARLLAAITQPDETLGRPLESSLTCHK